MVMSQVGKDVIGILAVQVAKTSIDPQDFPGKLRSVWALKPHFNSLGLVGCAAPAVCADAAVLGSVWTSAHAPRDGVVHRLVGLVDSQALLPRLNQGRTEKRQVNIHRWQMAAPTNHFPDISRALTPSGSVLQL